MKAEQIQLVREHKNIFINNNTINPIQKKQIYAIYNSITGESKQPTGCGRCVASVLKRVYFEYQKYDKL